ncbi:MAG: 4Fe-4S dicluster domain-containing protein, partial [Deltaproteobacteria bacterium]|nr:4Fe-4S dicluster domain-containing protein [Deltaproteobacteria bacterium]
MTPTRPLYWNIEHHWLMYLGMLLALGICFNGFYRRCSMWRMGRGAMTPGDLRARLKSVLFESLLQRRIMRRPLSGAPHWAIFWCFAVSLFATAVISVQEHLGMPLFQGSFYLWLSLALDLLGGLALAAALFYLLRRAFFKPARMDNTKTDFIALGLIALILFSGFLVESLRIAGTNDPWASWSPVGNFLAPLWGGLDAGLLRPVFQALWWGHLFSALVFIAYMPYGKLAHLMTAPLSQFFHDAGRRSLPWMNLEDADAGRFGIARLADYCAKDLLDATSCTDCGRCQDGCPAWRAGKKLSPKKNIQAVRMQLERHLDAPDISAQEVWACTTCGACEEQCPVFVRHGKLMAGWRRNLVLTEDDYPAEFQLLYRNLERNANPWGVGRAERGLWNDEAETPVPVLGKGGAAQAYEYLYWAGCSASFDARNQNTARAVCGLLRLAGISFAILGDNEPCCGDPARRTGNEYIFQMLARANVELFKNYGVKKIITACPHCFNVFSGEYAQLGLELEVTHHTQFLFRLLRAGKLKLTKALSGILTYHDPCYLGRYNGEFAAPRELLRAVGGISLREMSECKAESFCCGAGGGHMWLEDNDGGRINEERARHIAASGAERLAVACPYCMTMLADGLRSIGAEDLRVADIGE